MITPFTEDGKLDKKALRKLVDFTIQGGVHGLFICGSYGAFPLMTLEERKQVTEVVIQQAQGRISVIVQVGTEATWSSIELAKHASENGATAVASVVPYYYSSFAYSEDQILRHFECLVEAVDVPVIFYNNPKTTGYTASTRLLARLVDVGVSGLKDSTGDMMLLSEYINHIHSKTDNFTFMIGTVGLMLPAYVLGVRSYVPGTANVLPEAVVELHETLESGDMERAKELQLRLIEVRRVEGVEGFRPSACYSIARMRGQNFGTCRPPWKELSKPSYKYVEKELRRLGML